MDPAAVQAAEGVLDLPALRLECHGGGLHKGQHHDDKKQQTSAVNGTPLRGIPADEALLPYARCRVLVASCNGMIQQMCAARRHNNYMQ